MISCIEPGQVYESADRPDGPTVRVLSTGSTYSGRPLVFVEDADTGKRRRWILAKQFHPTPWTRLAGRRLTGYVLKHAGGDPFPSLPREQPDSGPECNGICMTAGDIGLPEYGNAVAYPHPECEKHGGDQ